MITLGRLVDGDHPVGLQAQRDCAQVTDLNRHALELAHISEIQARGLPAPMAAGSRACTSLWVIGVACAGTATLEPANNWNAG